MGVECHPMTEEKKRFVRDHEAWSSASLEPEVKHVPAPTVNSFSDIDEVFALISG